jgi:hypothetical protein
MHLQTDHFLLPYKPFCISIRQALLLDCVCFDHSFIGALSFFLNDILWIKSFLRYRPPEKVIPAVQLSCAWILPDIRPPNYFFTNAIFSSHK